MKSFAERLEMSTVPKANEGAIVLGPQVRFTVLTSRLIRIEYSKGDCFRDVATKTVLNRELSVPVFEVINDVDKIVIKTEHIELTYNPNILGFTRDTFKIHVKETDNTWFYGLSASNLKGTLRTLDHVDGSAPLEEGLMSKDGYAVIDDTESFILTDDNWFEEVYYPAGSYEDLYFFGYGRDYKACLRDFTRIAGEVPMLPRWTLGNWWSRYWEYSQDELLGLMSRFQDEDIPLSVCIVDMDWHITDVSGGGSGGWSAGWTGYTWDKKLFPDPQGFMEELHSRGLRTALNLHPADGLLPHEDMYEEMAEFMGMDPDKGETIHFNITDKKFAEGYFDIMHQPHEKDGVDFWWMDWQQGKKSKGSHLDPLFLLNHLHFMDGAKEDDKRPFIFSRWGGLGNHRYPIGFSGDTTSSWASLAFQPYLTATAANVGYGWWSHDIGGHHNGIQDGELYTRWVQYGVFSPIMRLHSTKQRFADRHPWGYSEEVLNIAGDYMRLRHRLIPYIYTISWDNYKTGIPGFLPLYYEHPYVEEAYQHGNEYYFGEQLIVSPYIEPADKDIKLSRQTVWLPEGDWYGFFDGEYFKGDEHYALYGELSDMPVFAKAGAIVPLGKEVNWGGIDNSDELELVTFPGADGSYTLFEDDGQSQRYDKDHALTKFTQVYEGQQTTITVCPVNGNKKLIPENRNYRLQLKGINEPTNVLFTINGQEIDVKWNYEDGALYTEAIQVNPEDTLEVKVQGEGELAIRERQPMKQLEKLIINCNLDTQIKEQLWCNRHELMESAEGLGSRDATKKLTTKCLLALMECINDKPIYMMQ